MMPSEVCWYEWLRENLMTNAVNINLRIPERTKWKREENADRGHELKERDSTQNIMSERQKQRAELSYKYVMENMG